MFKRILYPILICTITFLITITILAYFPPAIKMLEKKQLPATSECNCQNTKTVDEDPVVYIAKPGEVLKLAGNQWISLAEDIDDWEFGDTCLAQKHQLVEVIKMINKTEALIHYLGAAQSGGTLCPSGILATINMVDYANIQLEEIASAEKKAQIIKIIKQEGICRDGIQKNREPLQE